jgi:hypothetical protein
MLDGQGLDLEGDMIPQERGIEGLRIYFICLFSIFFLMENSCCMRFFGASQDVLVSQELINPSMVCWGGWSWLFILSSHSHSLFRSVVGCSTCSCIHSCTFSLFTPLVEIALHSLPHSFIFPHACLGSGKEYELLK